MSLITFTPSTTILSASVNGNFTGLSDGTLDTANNSMANFRSEAAINFVYSGFAWATSASLTTTMTAGVAYVKGVRVSVSSIGSHTFTASKDTYIDVNTSGTIFYVEVANGATSGMTITANSIRLAKVVTSGSAVTTVTQTGWDSLGNAIYNINPLNNTLGYAQITANVTTASVTATQITGLTAPVIIPTAGRRVKITAYTAFLYNTTGTDQAFMTIWDGAVGAGTQLQSAHSYAPAANTGSPATAIAIVTPAAGNKTYNVGLNANAGVAGVECTSIAPAFIMVELI